MAVTIKCSGDPGPGKGPHQKDKTLRTAIWYFVLSLTAIAMILPSPRLGAQQGHPQCVASGPAGSCSPAQLGINTLTEPGVGTSALSSIIDMRGVTELGLFGSCTQGNVTINVQTYAEDGTTAAALVSPVSAIAGAAQFALFLGEESNPATNIGTLSATAFVRMPERALAFSFTNANASAGTCTARLILSYH
jgi:hypothetical protein